MEKTLHNESFLKRSNNWCGTTFSHRIVLVEEIRAQEQILMNGNSVNDTVPIAKHKHHKES